MIFSNLYHHKHILPILKWPFNYKYVIDNKHIRIYLAKKIAKIKKIYNDSYHSPKTDRTYLLVVDGDDGLHGIRIGARHFILVTSKESGQIDPWSPLSSGRRSVYFRAGISAGTFCVASNKKN